MINPNTSLIKIVNSFLIIIAIFLFTSCGSNNRVNGGTTISTFAINGVSGTISGTNINVVLPSGTDVTGLIATFTTTGSSVTVGTTPQISGVTANNFTSPVTYTVTATNGNTQNYIVTVTLSSSTKNITAYSINGVVGTISGTNINVVLPSGTNVTALIATFTTTGSSVTVGTTPQISGVTANNFTSTVTYTVTALDSSTQNYIVTVILRSNYVYLSQNNGVTSCLLNPTTKLISSCNNYNLFSSVTQGIATLNNYIYVMLPGTPTVVQLCNISSNTGVVSGCSVALSGAPLVNTTTSASIFIATVGSNTYAYISNVTNIVQCTVNINTGSLSGCAISGTASGTNLLAIIVNPSGTIAYISDFFNNDVQTCLINSSTGALTGCTAAGASGMKQKISFAINGNYFYASGNDTVDSTQGVTVCTINGATLNSCSSTTITTPVLGSSFFNNQFYVIQQGTPANIVGCSINATTGQLINCGSPQSVLSFSANLMTIQ